MAEGTQQDPTFPGLIVARFVSPGPALLEERAAHGGRRAGQDGLGEKKKPSSSSFHCGQERGSTRKIRNSNRNFMGNFIRNISRNISRNLIRNFIRNFIRNSIRHLSRNSIRNFI